jgi:hypothetical protein
MEIVIMVWICNLNELFGSLIRLEIKKIKNKNNNKSNICNLDSEKMQPEMR